VKFGPVPVEEAAGSLLAHSLRLGELVLKKGHCLTAQDVARLREAGCSTVVAARLEPDDVLEDEAAARVAAALTGEAVDCAPAHTGRANLFARRAGLVRVDAPRIHAVNAVHESLTVATLLDFTPVTAGQMLATIKVIPYAVPGAALAAVLGRTGGGEAAIRVAPYCGLGLGLVMTRLPETRTSVLSKMRASVAGRLVALEAQLVAERVVPHETQALGAAIAALAAAPGVGAVLVAGIAATVDRADVVPAGIDAAGGRVLHAGMPVDPGNLLVLGRLERPANHCPVVGIPTCARSPKLNGFDFVLRRLAAGLEVRAQDIMSMGVGGLLGEIPSRPMPRA
jgi:molybdenum cofactor cytidylyltransferase